MLIEAKMYIPQAQLENLRKTITAGKVTIIYGPRRVGKTTLIQKFMDTLNKSKLYVAGDDLIAQQYLGSQSIERLKSFIGEHQYLFIDEAQYVKQIGLNLKLIVDHIPHVAIVASGSSSFELASQIGEPLTGRRYVLKLYPLAQLELTRTETRMQTEARLGSRLVFGSYPEVITMNDNHNRQRYLNELVNAYLFKDILALEGVRHSDKLIRLLQLLAFQIGKTVSISELGSHLGMSKNTVDRYIDLLEKAFVIFRRTGFSRNLRKELTKNSRFYFYDNGIRNAVIGNFNPLEMRNDIGQLWENYIITERLKQQEYKGIFRQSYFWRTYSQQEIDLVEETGGKLCGFEIKWKAKKISAPTEWRKTYPAASFEVISPENYLDFII